MGNGGSPVPDWISQAGRGGKARVPRFLGQVEEARALGGWGLGERWVQWTVEGGGGSPLAPSRWRDPNHWAEGIQGPPRPQGANTWALVCSLHSSWVETDRS